jgi:hypothetical protein
MNTAKLIEVLDAYSSRYQLFPPWKGRKFVIVTRVTLKDGTELTQVHAAEETGAVEGAAAILDTIDGHPSHRQVLEQFGDMLA